MQHGPAWFGPKAYGVTGLSFIPIRWQGWAVTGITALLAGLAVAVLPTTTSQIVGVVIVLAVYVAIGRYCYDPTVDPT